MYGVSITLGAEAAVQIDAVGNIICEAGGVDEGGAGHAEGRKECLMHELVEGGGVNVAR